MSLFISGKVHIEYHTLSIINANIRFHPKVLSLHERQIAIFIKEVSCPRYAQQHEIDS